MDVLLTPVKELEEDMSYEMVAEKKLHEEQSQYNKEQCLKSASKLSTQPISNENSLLKYKCTIPNCETCRKRAGSILSDETNSHQLGDAKNCIVESQSREKSDTELASLSKSNKKQTDTVNQKHTPKNTAKKVVAMGSASSVSKNKKQSKDRMKQNVSKNSDLHAEARLQKGKEYEAKTSKALKRIEAKYKAMGPAKFSSLQSQSTPVIVDVYPTKQDNADELLKKVKVTTTNLPYHARSQSAPSRKKNTRKQQDPPKSSRVKKNVKGVTDAELISKTPRTPKENDENEEQNVEIVVERKSDVADQTSNKSTDIMSCNSNTPDINVESAMNELNLGFDNDVDVRTQAMHGIAVIPPYVRQAAMNEGVEEIVLIDLPANLMNSDETFTDILENHKLNQTSKLDDDDSGNKNDSTHQKIDSKLLSEDQHYNDEMLDLNDNLKKRDYPADYRLEIDIPTTSESSTDHSLSSVSEKSALSRENNQSKLESHESSMSSGSSIRMSLQAMFDFEFDECRDKSRGNCKVENHLDCSFKETPVIVLEDVESSSDDEESDDDETSSFVIIPNKDKDTGNEYTNTASNKLVNEMTIGKGPAEAIPCQRQGVQFTEDSLDSKTSYSSSSFTHLPMYDIQNVVPAITDRPVSSEAWGWNENDNNYFPTIKNTLEQGVPFENYQILQGKDITFNEEDASVLHADGGDCLLFGEPDPSIQSVLTKQAIMKHNMLHNKHLDVVRDTEPHYKDEDRTHMQSRLSSATATTDFSIVTDSTLTNDMDTSEFNGLKKGKELGHGAYGTVFEGLTADGKLIAVKEVELTISNRDIATKEYKRVQCEVSLLRTLQHENIVRLLGTSFDGACVRIFMEHVPGGSIKSILTQYGALHERIFRKYTKQILEGLVYLHNSGVVHRDIKGSNIMLMTTGTVKLIDFGCAKRLRESALLRESTGSRDAKLLKTMLGTPYWMAPEVITSQGHGPKSDIWSVGATVYEMATTQPPLKNLESTAAMFHIGSGNEMPELPRQEFSRSVINFIKKCFTRDQFERPNASELLNHRFMIHQKVAKLTPK